MDYVVSAMLVVVGVIHLQPAAFVAGFASVVPFLWLAWPVGNNNAHVARVFRADVVALLRLLVGIIAYAMPATASATVSAELPAIEQHFNRA